ncbi:MAG: alpha/beta hydrolase [Methyloligellaceae bacterium]
MPRTQEPFLNHEEDGRRARKTFSGRVYWADETYSDRRVLMHVPKGFDPHRPSVMVVFFHGHGATLQRDVATRQRVPAQITESGVNAVLVAPQFAVDARDSSAGKFWRPGGMRRFLDEVADKLTETHGDPKARRIFATMPVVIVGYSGGFLPTAAALANGQIGKRVKGVVLLDGLYGQIDTFAKWIERDPTAFFVSAYTGSTRRGNASLKKKLDERLIGYDTALAAKLGPGSVTFLTADEEHRHYVTRAWANNPIADLLGRLTGVARRAVMDQSASLTPGIVR